MKAVRKYPLFWSVFFSIVLLSVSGVWASLLWLQGGPFRHTYFAYNPAGNSSISIAPQAQAASFRVVDLQTGVIIASGTVAAGATRTISPGQPRYLKVESDEPVSAYLGYDCCNFGGSFTYPVFGGASRVGRSFSFVIPVLSGTNEFLIFAYEDSEFTVRDSSGATVLTQSLTRGRYYRTTGFPLQAGQLYSVTSTGDISCASNTGNGNAPIPSSTGRDMGTYFLFGTHDWGGGAIAVFGYEQASFSIINIDTGAALVTNQSISEGQTFYRSGVGRNRYRLESTGNVAVWAGDLESGSGIADMGDDITLNQGRGGRLFYLHSQTQGAFVFAGQDSTHLVITYYNSDGSTTTEEYDRDRDGTLAIPPQRRFRLQASKPVVVQTIGGNGLNDWGKVMLEPYPFDDQAPETSITVGPSQGDNVILPVQFGWTAVDDFTPENQLLFQYRLDQGTWSEWSTGREASLSNIAEGDHVFEVRAKDLDDNVDSTPAVRSFMYRRPVVSSVSISPSTVKGGSNATLRVQMNAPAPVDLVVSLSSDRPEAMLPPEVTIPRRSSYADVQVSTSLVAYDVSARIGATYSGLTESTTLSIESYKATSIALTPSRLKGGATSIATVTIDAPAPAQGLDVAVTSSSNSASVPAVVHVAPSSLSASFDVHTEPVTVMVTARITAALGGVTRQSDLIIEPPYLTVLRLEPDTVRGSVENSIGTVEMDMVAPSGGFEVLLSSNRPQAQVPQRVVIAQGSSSATFTIQTSAVTTATQATILARYGDSEKSNILTITPPQGVAPETQITAPASASIFQQPSVFLSYTGSDLETPIAALHFFVRINGGNWSGPFIGPGSQQVLLTIEGVNSIEVKARDADGIEDPTPAVVHVILDTVDLVISNLHAEEVRASSSLIRWQTNKPATSQVSFRQVGTPAWTDTPATSSFIREHAIRLNGLTPETEYEYRARSRDRSGRVVTSGIQTFRTRRDDTPPDTAITFGPRDGGSVRPGDVVFQWTGGDDATPVNQLRYQYSVDGGTWTPIEPSRDTTVTIGATELRGYTFAVRAHDQTGNVDPTPALVHFNVDNTAPGVDDCSITPIEWNRAHVNWVASEPVLAMVQYALRDGDFIYSQSSETLSANGSLWIGPLASKSPYRVRIVVTDEAGNQGVSQVKTFTTADLADIAFDDIGFSSTAPADGDSISMTATVSNRGDLPIAADVVFFDRNPGGDREVGRQRVTLQPYAASPTAVSSNAFTVSEGLHRPYAEFQNFSRGDYIASNDRLHRDLVVGSPRNLLSLSVSNPYIWPGHRGRLTVTVKNIGSNPHSVSSVTVASAISTTRISPLPAAPLQPGESAPILFEFTAPPNLNGGTRENPVRISATAQVSGVGQFAFPFAFEALSEPASTMTVRVIDGSYSQGTQRPINGATVGFSDTNEQYTTDADGYIVDELGARTSSATTSDSRIINAAAPRFGTSQMSVPVQSGPGEYTIVLLPGNALEIREVQVRELTAAEVAARGVNIEDPINNWVYDFTVVLGVGPCEVRNIILPRNIASCGYCPSWGGYYIVPGYGGVAIGSSYTPGPGGYQQGIIVIAGEIKILKQFWEATVFVRNNTAFPMVNARADISIPAGIGLPELFGEPQENPIEIGNIGAGQEAQAAWVIRGDVPGVYSLTARANADVDVAGTLVPLETTCVSPTFQVVQPSFRVDFIAPARVAEGQNFNFGVKIRNLSPITLQRVVVRLKPEKLVNCAPAGPIEIDLGALAPGAEATANFTLVSFVTGCVHCLSSEVSGGTSIEPCVNIIGDAVGLERSSRPGDGPCDKGKEPWQCGDKPVGGNSSYATGNAHGYVKDPVQTRGYPLLNTIHFSSQGTEFDRPLRNMTFTYDMHVTRETVYAGGAGTLQWTLVDGDGTRLHCGPASAPPTRAQGMFSQLTQTANGFELARAGAPESIEEAGNFRYQFDRNGRLLRITDPSGNVQLLSYDADGLPSRVLDQSSGRVLDIIRSNGVITRFRENGGVAWTDILYQSGRVRAILMSGPETGLNTRVDFQYDELGRFVKITRDFDKDGAILFTYTPAPISSDPNRPVYMTNVQSGPWRTNYQWGQVPGPGAVDRITKTNSKGGQVHYDIDTRGDVIRVTHPQPEGASGPKVFTFAWDGDHQPTASSDGINTVHFEYGPNGKLTRFTDSDGRMTDYTYQGANLLTVTDEMGELLRLTYGSLQQPNLPTVIKNGVGDEWRFEYNVFGQVIRTIYPDGSAQGPSSMAYEENAGSPNYGYAKQFVDGVGSKVNFNSYNAGGDLTQLTTYVDGKNLLTAQTRRYTYDGLHRMTSAQEPDGKLFRWIYTGRRLTKTIDEAGTQTLYDFCKDCGKLVGLDGPLGWALRWVYDGDRDLTSFKDARGNTTTYTYGQARELKSVNYPDGTGMSYRYDQAGRVREKVNGRGHVIRYLYDQAGRLAGMDFPTSNEPSIRYYYNPDGTLQRMTDAVGTTDYEYWPDRLVKSAIYDYRVSGLVNVQRIDYDYNPDQSLASMTWMNGTTLACGWEYDYDLGGRMTRVANTFGDAVSYAYDGEGKITRQTNSNGTRTDYQYNQARGWLTQIKHTGPNGVFARYDMQYDGGANTVGNLTRVTELDGTVVNYGYDALYRLTGEQSPRFSRGYGYDLAGNLTQVDGSPVATYDAANKIATIAGGAATYDGDGNMRSVNGSGLTALSNIQWDDRNKLTMAETGGLTTQFGYDGIGLRVSRSVGGGRSFYVFDDELLVGEVDSAGTVRSVVTWGPDGIVSEQRGDIASSLHYGAQGETRFVVNSHGEVTGRANYGAYGSSIGQSTLTSPFQYKGKYGYFTENAVPIVLCTFRFYSPELTRWMSRDPIGYRGGTNLYSYVDSNPIMWIDPDGEGKIKVLVETVKGCRKLLELTADQIAKLAHKNPIVIGRKSRKRAREIAEKAYGDVVEHGAHGGRSRHPHFQPKKRNGRRGHVNYAPAFAPAIPGSNIGQQICSGLCGDTIDFFNPLSDIEDVRRMIDEIFGEDE